MSRVDLDAPLEGHWIEVDPDEVTFGLLEDFQSEQAKLILDALARVIVDSDLPKGHDRAGLRRLKSAEIGEVIAGVMRATRAPKSRNDRIREVDR